MQALPRSGFSFFAFTAFLGVTEYQCVALIAQQLHRVTAVLSPHAHMQYVLSFCIALHIFIFIVCAFLLLIFIVFLVFLFNSLFLLVL